MEIISIKSIYDLNVVLEVVSLYFSESTNIKNVCHTEHTQSKFSRREFVSKWRLKIENLDRLILDERSSYLAIDGVGETVSLEFPVIQNQINRSP